MKLAYFGAFTAIAAKAVCGYSFSFVSAPSLASVSGDHHSGNIMSADEENRIFGGRNAKIDKYPYMAGLRENEVEGQSFCGGTLVAPQYVVTAAHCLEGVVGEVYVSLGTQRVSGRGSRRAEQIRVVEAFSDPRYNSTWATYDVAMLKLETPARHQPATLCAADGSDNKPGTMVTALGWGLVNNENTSETLQNVDVEIIPDDVCANYTISTDSVMCAGVGDGKDSCQGDSGGPLIANEVLVGIVSSGGEYCGVAPGMYTRITGVLDFVHDIMNGGSSGNITDKLTPGAAK